MLYPEIVNLVCSPEETSHSSRKTCFQLTLPIQRRKCQSRGDRGHEGKVSDVEARPSNFTQRTLQKIPR
jgi:hypothetical protein